MSPYTSAWGHYWTALFFHYLGTGLFVARLSGVALVVVGITFLSLALWRAGEAGAAAALPWVIAFFPALVMNHRFFIEINTFHVAALGLLAWGLSLRIFPKSSQKDNRSSTWLASALIALSIVLGVSSHILFLAPATAALLTYFGSCFGPDQSPTIHDSMRGDRFWMAAILLVLLLFFLQIFLNIPEKDKSLSLLIGAGLLLGALIFPKILTQLQVKLAKLIFLAWALGGGISVFFLLFFAEGTWSAAFFNGGNTDLRALGWPLLAIALLLSGSLKPLLELVKEPRWKNLALGALLTVILTAILATKPAPRYYEVPLLLLSVALALGLSRCRSLLRLLVILI